MQGSSTQRRSVTSILVFLIASVFPALGAAQTGTAGIAGTIRDASGAVIPGVTVEASSPALIEKVRTAVSDETGQYRVVELRPGIYTVTFTLPGFTTVKREGVELTVGFTATINAEMRVGSLEETITVTGDTPVVDIQNVRQTAVMTREVIDAIPTGKQFQNLATLVPGMVVVPVAGSQQDVGGQSGQNHATLQIHGGRSQDLKLYVDGMGIVASTAPGTNGLYFTDGNFQEFVVDAAAGPAEQETGGVRINMIPREGGNQFKGTLTTNFTNTDFAGNNIDDELRRTGLRDPNNVKSVWSLNPTLGGPIQKDRVWFFGTVTRSVTDTYIAGGYYNLTPGTRFYNPDLGRQSYDDFWANDVAGRVTWQATARNKFTGYYDYNRNCHCHFRVAANLAPDASNYMIYRTHTILATWSAPLNNRILFEAAVMHAPQTSQWDAQPDAAGPSITESQNGLSYANAGLGRTYYDEPTRNFRGSMSYVTGAHAAKIGFQLLTKTNSRLSLRDGNMSYTLLNNEPVNVTYTNTPAVDTGYVRPLFGLFAQDQWTLARLTVNAGVRFDYLRFGYDDTIVPPIPNVPVERFFPGIEKGNFKDLSPRVGVAYNLFGNGRTAIKATVNRYVGAAIPNVNGAVSALGSDSRRWTDLNGNFFPDGDPTNPAGNGELGPQTNGRFGEAFIPLRYDPNAFGFGRRPATNWEYSAGIQHELAPRVAVNASYFRRVYTVFQVTDNQAVGAADYDPYCVTAPSDARLPGGGGHRICGLYDLNPARVGRTDNVVKRSSDFGDQRENWNGVDFTMSARLPGSVLLQGGLSTGRTFTDDCGVKPDNPSLLYCQTETPYLTQVKILGSYRLPWDVQVAGTFQNIPGPQILANAVFTSAQVAPTLGRSLSSASTVTVNVVAPGTLYGERLTQLDFRLSKSVRVGRTRIEGQFDIYNAMNGNAVFQMNNTYGTNGASWRTPQRILAARLFKFGMQLDF